MTRYRNTPCVQGYEKPPQTVPVTADCPDNQRMAALCVYSCHSALMHITRRTNQELVVLDSSIWISVFLLFVSAFVSYRLFAQADQKGLLIVALFLLFAALFWRREVVVFDAARQRATWTRRRLFKVATGTIPFSGIISGIIAIGLETTSAGHSLSYRLAILTTEGSIPMSDSYEGNLQKYEEVKQEILEFVGIAPDKATSAGPAPSTGIDDEVSVRSLLKQGRKIDAIQLVRTTQNLSLTEAVERVAAINEQMK